jgi:hypothetical protein
MQRNTTAWEDPGEEVVDLFYPELKLIREIEMHTLRAADRPKVGAILMFGLGRRLN